jgi:hypothetical protein
MNDDSEREIKEAVELYARSQEAFSKAHKEGRAALSRRDYAALSQIIKDEGNAIEQHRQAAQQLGRLIDKSLNK